MLLPAVALALPQNCARIGIRWSAGILAALGVVDGYLGSSHSGAGGSGLLLSMSPFYLLAAVALVLSERLIRSEPSEPEMS